MTRLHHIGITVYTYITATINAAIDLDHIFDLLGKFMADNAIVDVV